MSGAVTIGWSRPRPTSGGFAVPEGSDLPRMRARTKGKAARDPALAEMLGAALEDMARSNCSFWACEGPNGRMEMTMCCKCQAMRYVATVKATLEARNV